METRKIGSLDVSVVGLGTVNFGGRLDERQSSSLIDAALDVGINFVDTADSYGNTRCEEIIGRSLGPRRDEVVLATKFGFKFDEDHPGGARPGYARSCAEESLRRLKTDYIDLFILHRPDPETPVGETLLALNELITDGKVREIGCSNFSIEQLREAEDAAVEGQARFVNVQNRYSLLHRAPEMDVLPECERSGISFVPFAPLMKGLLTGKYFSDSPLPEGANITLLPEERRSDFLSEHNLAITTALREFCSRNGRSMIDLAVSWLLAHPAISSVIAGASSPDQVRANVAASTWNLSPEALVEIDQIAR